MNLMIGVLVGGLVGWAAYASVAAFKRHGLQVCLFIGIAGGALGVQFAPMLTSHVTTEGQFSLFSLIVAAAGAIGCLTMRHMLSGNGKG